MCVCWAHRQSHLRGVVNTKYSSTIHPAASAAHLVSGSASGPPVVAHTHQQPKQQPCGQGEGSASSAAGVGGGGGGGGTRTTAAVQWSTQRGTAQSSVTWVRAANVPHALHGRKRVSTEACEGPVSRCLVPAMHGSAPSTRRHTQVGEELHCGCASS